MADKEKSPMQLFIDTSGATTNVLLLLIQDLVPIIGINEAQRLINIIDDVQHGKFTKPETNKN